MALLPEIGVESEISAARRPGARSGARSAFSAQAALGVPAGIRYRTTEEPFLKVVDQVEKESVGRYRFQGER
ncbi:MAG: hypothetical protein WA383_18865 [Terriglobales bacterium]